MTLTERKRRVLEAVIENYIETAAPVGSRTLARKYGLGFSPATIRNEMADLEDLGYLEQPHTSAGRIPSDRGYRLYVDSLMQIRRLALSEIRLINEVLMMRTGELEYMISITARVLSEMTSCLSLVDGPRPEELKCTKIDLLPVNSRRVLMIMFTNAGLVEHWVLDVPDGVTPEELGYVSAILNQHLQGQSLQSLQRHIIDSLRGELDRYRQLAASVINLLSDAVRATSEDKVTLGGTTHIMSHPEFQDVSRVRNVLQAVECAQHARQLMAVAGSSGSPVIMIGEEIQMKEFQDCSLVIAPYYVGGRLMGRLGVLGPRRMAYGRIVAVVSQVADALSEALGQGE